ncbi:peptide-methionine (R)-S-oxide reductase MsrB [Undibacterium sp. TJN25]|uniref:peptide-methionine (R)-S-oxide reductase MsrB n=1 Tax=Undibacterium sp. TJN25 TaxID=3413056 RepID=UPI003BF45478
MKKQRRVFLGFAVLAAGAATLRGVFSGASAGTVQNAVPVYEISHSDAEWRKLLTPKQYSVLRQAGTEYPFSSPLDHEKRSGVFSCAGCALPLFSSQTKFDSGTGWPSFWKPLDNAVVKSRDVTLGMVRDEILCHRCGGHLGHVFEDGPKPTGLRYCMNGVAMNFGAGAELPKQGKLDVPPVPLYGSNGKMT